MKSKILLFFLVVFFSFGCRTKDKIDTALIKWTEVESIPASFGSISKGVSAAFVGLLDDKLIVAGGCNFPDVPAAEGGKKVFYKDILLFDGYNWTKIGELPEPLAYGISISTGDAIYFIGGQNMRPASSFYKLKYDDNLTLEILPSLPVSFDNGAGALLDNKIVVFGGNQDGKPSSDMWSFDVNGGENWEKLPSLAVEGGLVQPVAVSQKFLLRKKEKKTEYSNVSFSVSSQQLLIFGGFSPASGIHPAKVNQKIFSFDELVNRDWDSLETKFSENSEQTSFSGGVGVALDDSLIFLLGGVNKQIFEEALNRNLYLSKVDENQTDSITQRLRKEASGYLHHPAAWYKFNDEVWLYNSASDEWKSLGKFPQSALAGASVVKGDDCIYLVNGEIKPGIRTPKIWKITW